MTPPIAPVAIATIATIVQRIRSLLGRRIMRRLPSSERLHVLDQRGLVCVGKHRPVHVSAVAVTRHSCDEYRKALSAGLWHIGHESHVFLIEHVIAPEEHLWPRGGCIEQRAERGHG